MPLKVFEKLEKKRGMISRSAYVREVLKTWWKQGNDARDFGEGDKKVREKAIKFCKEHREDIELVKEHGGLTARAIARTIERLAKE